MSLLSRNESLSSTWPSFSWLGESGAPVTAWRWWWSRLYSWALLVQEGVRATCFLRFFAPAVFPKSFLFYCVVLFLVLWLKGKGFSWSVHVDIARFWLLQHTLWNMQGKRKIQGTDHQAGFRSWYPQPCSLLDLLTF